MTPTTPNTSSPHSEVSGLISLYKQAIKNVPVLKYSWVLIATVCILALAAYFKLKNSDVFFYALLVIVISFLGFLFSYLLKTQEKFIRFLLYLLLTSLVITIGTAVLGFGTFIIWEKPAFYNRWFPNQSHDPSGDTTKKIKADSVKIPQNNITQNDTAKEDRDEKNIRKKEVFPVVTGAGIWKPAAYIIPKNKKIKLAQFELYGIKSAYEKTLENFGSVGTKNYPTYSIDPNYYQLASASHTLDPIPIFNVVLENTTDREILITKTLYRVSRVDQVKGGDYGLLEPNARYEHILEWKTGDQEFSLVPPFRIAPRAFGSFLIQLKTNKKDIGLCWLMKAYFITSMEEGGVSTEEFQLIMTGPYN